MSKPGIKVVLSGSGLLYPIHVGAIVRLQESFEIEEVAGISGGAIVAALVASGKSGQELLDLVLDNMPGDHLNLIDPAWFPPSSWGLIKGKRLLAKFREMMVPTFGNTEIPLTVGTTNIDKRLPVMFSSEDTPEADLPLAVRASMSFPFAFAPVLIDGDRYVDGGLGASFPLDIFGSGEDVIGVKIVPQMKRGYHKVDNLIEFAFANIQTMMGAIDREHIEDAVFARFVRIETDANAANLFMRRNEAGTLAQLGYNHMHAWLAKH